MRWAIDQYEFDADTKRLRSAGRDVLLEPKAAALLSFFCQNPGRDIGREELLQAVWYGQIVSDNSINRVVVLLRKALQDDDKVRQYIATIPKLGYRFIADVSAIENSRAPLAVRTGSEQKNHWLAFAGVGLALLTVFAYMAQDKVEQPVAQVGPAVTPLSRLAVSQNSADLAHDGHTLLYTASGGTGNAVFMVSDALAEPLRISAAGGDGDFGTWASGDEFIVYLFTQGARCEFHKVALVDGVPQKPSVLHQCAANSYSEFAFSADNSKLYFIERMTGFSPYALYELDLERSSKRRLSQPVGTGLGNYFFDVHPDTGMLLLLTDHVPGRTSVYELDAPGDSFKLRKTFSYSLNSALWSHRANHIVHPSKHPSYQLLETALDSDQSQVIVSDSRRISSPRRIRRLEGDSRDYLFTSYLYNRDIDVVNGAKTPSNSAVMDYLPSISHSGEQLAFVSKRSGYSQIWIRDFRDDSLVSIEPRETGRRFFSLAWSPDDRKILANTDTGIFIYSLEKMDYLHDIEPALPAYAASWHDEQTLSYSQFEDRRWHAYRYSLATKETTAVDNDWAFSLKNGEQHLLLDQSLKVYRDGAVLTPIEACASLVWRYQLRLQLDRDKIYCNARDAFSDLLRFDAGMNVVRLTDIVHRFEFYSVSNGEIAATSVTSAHSDIMRTRFVPET